MNTELRQLAIDVYNGVDVKFENGETGEDMIRNAINKAFGNINLNDANAVKRAIAYGKVGFEIINELIDAAINLSAEENSELWDFVDFKSLPRLCDLLQGVFFVLGNVVAADTHLFSCALLRQSVDVYHVNASPLRACQIDKFKCERKRLLVGCLQSADNVLFRQHCLSSDC